MRNAQFNLKGIIAILAIIALPLATNGFVAAQSVTPTSTTSGTPTLIVPTTSLTISPTITTTPTNSPTPTPTPKVDAIYSTATVGAQYPWNKRIPVKLHVTPSVSGKKLEVRWQKRAGLIASPSSMTLPNPQAGQTYTVTFTLTPYSIGYQRAVADIIVTTNTTNYVTSLDIPIQLDDKKTVVPKTSTYYVYLILMYLLIFLVFFVAIPFGIYQGYLYAKKTVIPRWLESKIQSPT